MNKSFLVRLVMLVGASAMTSNSNAAVFCTGTVAYVGVDPGGTVTLFAPSLAPDAVYVCQIGGTQNGTSSDACKAVYATLLAAQISGATVRWAFNDSIACGQRPTWTYLQNWYWGPIVSS